MHTILKGMLSFGLINIPVRVYSGTESHQVKFDLLHEKDHSPIRYARICKKEGVEVPWKEIVKGYEDTDGNYIVLTDEDFENAALEQERKLEITEFVQEEEIESVFFEKPYLLEPDKGAEKAYILLKEALKKSKKVGVVEFILHKKQHMGILKDYNDYLILNQIRYASDLRDVSKLEVPETKVSEKEVDMALKLINELTTKFNPDQYKDTYNDKLMEIIKNKKEGKEVKVPKMEYEAEPKVVDLMGMLKESLEKEKKKKKSA